MGCELNTERMVDACVLNGLQSKSITYYMFSLTLLYTVPAMMDLQHWQLAVYNVQSFF